MVLFRLSLAAVICFLTLTASALAQPKTLPLRAVIVAVNGPNALTDAEIGNALQAAKQSYSSIGVDFKLIAFLRIDDERLDLNSINTRLAHAFHVQKKARQLGLARPRRVVHFIYPPMTEGYFAGIAHGVCTYHTRLNVGSNTALSNAAMVNVNNAPRLQHSITALIHEVGHIAGAYHVTTPTMMNTNILSLVSSIGIPPWDNKSKKQIRKCLNANTRSAYFAQ